LLVVVRTLADVDHLDVDVRVRLLEQRYLLLDVRHPRPEHEIDLLAIGRRRPRVVCCASTVRFLRGPVIGARLDVTAARREDERQYSDRHDWPPSATGSVSSHPPAATHRTSPSAR
jgi:hypothetical protein